MCTPLKRLVPEQHSQPPFYIMRNVAMDVGTGPQRQKHMLPVDNATIPYWRTEPHALDEHRTTKTLPTGCDIAIVGAGMTGIATAYHISKLEGDNSPSVVILEARQLCSGATGRNGVSMLTHGWEALV